MGFCAFRRSFEILVSFGANGILRLVGPMWVSGIDLAC